jgi:hypothetical protein
MGPGFRRQQQRLASVNLRFDPGTRRIRMTRHGRHPEITIESKDVTGQFLGILVQYMAGETDLVFGDDQRRFRLSLTELNSEAFETLAKDLVRG